MRAPPTAPFGSGPAARAAAGGTARLASSPYLRLADEAAEQAAADLQPVRRQRDDGRMKAPAHVGNIDQPVPGAVAGAAIIPEQLDTDRIGDAALARVGERGGAHPHDLPAQPARAGLGLDGDAALRVEP